MGRKEEERDYKIVRSAVNILAVTCAANPEKIIDKLTGYLWDEEEARELKRTGVEFSAKDIF